MSEAELDRLFLTDGRYEDIVFKSKGAPFSRSPPGTVRERRNGIGLAA